MTIRKIAAGAVTGAFMMACAPSANANPLLDLFETIPQMFDPPPPPPVYAPRPQRPPTLPQCAVAALLEVHGPDTPISIDPVKESENGRDVVAQTRYSVFSKHVMFKPHRP